MASKNSLHRYPEPRVGLIAGHEVALMGETTNAYYVRLFDDTLVDEVPLPDGRRLIGAAVRRVRKEHVTLPPELPALPGALWGRCYACGHWLGCDGTSCPQCGITFDRRPTPDPFPLCPCPMCVRQRTPEVS